MIFEPTVWKDKDDFPPLGVSPQGLTVTGLSNGNFLASWIELSDSLAPAPQADVVGQLFDPLGNPLSGVLQLNEGIVSSGAEQFHRVSARDDGGFALAFVHTPPSFDTRGNLVGYGIFDAEGARLAGGLIDDTGATEDRIQRVHVGVGKDDTFLVAYELDGPSVDTIRGRVFDADGTPLSPLATLRVDGAAGGQPNAEDPSIGGVLGLADGGFLLYYTEKDENGGPLERTVEARQVSALGVLSLPVNISRPNGAEDFAPVAARVEGGFVFVWEDGGGLAARFMSEDFKVRGAEFRIPPTASFFDNEPSVVGLEDGGFFLLWDNDDAATSSLRGRRFDANGVPVGPAIDPFIDLVTEPSLSLTTDGRILMAAAGPDGGLAIYDPRAGEIRAEAQDGGVTTARQDGSVMIGLETAERLFGAAGDDEIDARGGDDSVFGGGGDDRLYGRDGSDTVDGGSGADRVYGDKGEDVVRGGNGADRVGGGHGDDLLSGGQGDDRISGHTGSDLAWGGSGRDAIFGNEGADRLGGNDGQDTIAGGAGNDTIWGGDGGDSLHGNTGDDRLFGGDGADRIRGGSGNDRLDGGDGWDTLTGDDGADVFVWTAPERGVRDVVTDFDPSADILRFDASAGARAVVRDVGRDVTVTVEGQVVLLLGIDDSDLTGRSIDLV